MDKPLNVDEDETVSLVSSATTTRPGIGGTGELLLDDGSHPVKQGDLIAEARSHRWETSPNLGWFQTLFKYGRYPGSSCLMFRN